MIYRRLEAGTNFSPSLPPLIACIGYGAVALYKIGLARSALKSELLDDPRVVQFYRDTIDAWASGRLAGLNASFQKDGSLA